MFSWISKDISVSSCSLLSPVSVKMAEDPTTTERLMGYLKKHQQEDVKILNRPKATPPNVIANQPKNGSDVFQLNHTNVTNGNYWTERIPSTHGASKSVTIQQYNYYGGAANEVIHLKASFSPAILVTARTDNSFPCAITHKICLEEEAYVQFWIESPKGTIAQSINAGTLVVLMEFNSLEQPN